MERQYIGARYVPKFADPIEWQDNRSYEPLTVVTYLGASYTSKKSVPAGIRPTDNRYWAVTGNYNAQVEEYRQQVSSITEDYNKRFKRKWLFLGDSYDRTAGWISTLAGMLGLSEGDYWNLAVGGHGFYNNLWITDLQTWVENNPAEVENIGHIVVGGGLNDSTMSAVPTLDGLISAFGAYCKSTFDEAVVHLAYFGWEIDGLGTTHPSTPEWRSKAQFAYSRASGRGMTYLSGCECAVHNRELFNEDGFHPNTNGGWQIASVLCNAIKTGYGAADWAIMDGTFTPVDGTVSGDIKQSITNNTVFTAINIVMGDMNTTFVGNQAMQVGELYLPLSNSLPLQVVDTRIRTPDDVYVDARFRVAVVNNQLVLNYQGLTGTGTEFASVTAKSLILTMNSAHSAISD